MVESWQPLLSQPTFLTYLTTLPTIPTLFLSYLTYLTYFTYRTSLPTLPTLPTFPKFQICLKHLAQISFSVTLCLVVIVERGGPCWLLKLETDVNGDSKRENDRGPSLVGLLHSSSQYNRFQVLSLIF